MVVFQKKCVGNRYYIERYRNILLLSAATIFFPRPLYSQCMDELRSLLAVIIMLSFAGCLQASAPHLDFTTAPCIPTIDPYTQPPAGILNQTWTDHRMLSVEAYLKTYCGGAVISGDYTVQGDHLVLFYNVTAQGPVTSCLCTHRLVYTISNIEKREYRVTIQER
jgi:hypothetical protein